MLSERYRTIGLITAANVIGNGATFFVLLVLSAMMTASRFGELSIAISIVMQGVLLLDLGTGLAMIRLYNSRTEIDAKERALKAGIAIRAFLTVVFLTLALPLQSVLNTWLFPKLNQSTLCGALLVVPLFAWWSFLRQWNQARQQHHRYATSVLVLSLLRCLMLIALLLRPVGDVQAQESVVLLYGVAPILAALIAWRRGVRREASSSISVRALLIETGRLTKYGKWIFVSTALFPLANNIPLWVLGSDVDMESAGAFGVGVYFANAIAPLREAIRFYIFPKIMSLQSPAEVGAYLNAVVKKAYFIIPIFFGVAPIAILAQEWINGDKYESAGLVIGVMIFVQILTMFSAHVGTVLHYLEKPQVDAAVNLVRVIACAGLAEYVVATYGAVGAALLSAVCIVGGEIVIFIMAKRYLTFAIRRV